jgi:hypothetical protein
MESGQNRYKKPRPTTTHQFPTPARRDGQAQLHDYLPKASRLSVHPKNTSPVPRINYHPHSHRSHRSHQPPRISTKSLNHLPYQANTASRHPPRLQSQGKSPLAPSLQLPTSTNSPSSPPLTSKTASLYVHSSYPPNYARSSYKPLSITRVLTSKPAVSSAVF